MKIKFFIFWKLRFYAFCELILNCIEKIVKYSCIEEIKEQRGNVEYEAKMLTLDEP